MTILDTKRLPEAQKTKAKPPKQTRKAQLQTLLSRATGASSAQIQQAFGWQPHTARAAISSLRKAGHKIELADLGKGPVYRIASLDAPQ